MINLFSFVSDLVHSFKRRWMNPQSTERCCSVQYHKLTEINLLEFLLRKQEGKLRSGINERTNELARLNSFYNIFFRSNICTQCVVPVRGVYYEHDGHPLPIHFQEERRRALSPRRRPRTQRRRCLVLVSVKVPWVSKVALFDLSWPPFVSYPKWKRPWRNFHRHPPWTI